jgi:ribonuclease P protein component
VREWDETDISAAKPPPQKQTWVPRSHEDEVGASGVEPAPQEGPQEASCVRAYKTRTGLTSEGHSRSRRLSLASEIQKVVRSGRRHRTKTLHISWLPNGLKHARLAVVVPRFGNTAVARNKLRRQLREIVRRRLLPSLMPIDLVISSRAAAYRAQFRELAAELEQWLSSFRESHAGHNA